MAKSLPGRSVTVKFRPLNSCLINLPLAIYGPLLERNLPPQSIVVQLSWNSTSDTSKNTVYLGWTGMPSQTSVNSSAHQASVNENVIDIDPQVAAEYGIKENSQVTIQLHKSLPRAVSANVSPLSADDWEILEINADFVEQHLLSQVRAVHVGQTLCVWVGKQKTLVKFSVDSFEPRSDLEAALLSTDSEVIIAPKSRVDTSAKHDLSSQQTSSSSESRSIDWTKHVYRLLPPDHVENIEHLISANNELINQNNLSHFPQAKSNSQIGLAFVHPLCWSNFLSLHLPSSGRAGLRWIKQTSWISQFSGGSENNKKNTNENPDNQDTNPKQTSASSPRNFGNGKHISPSKSKSKPGNDDKQQQQNPTNNVIQVIIVPTSSGFIPPEHIWVDDKVRAALGTDDLPFELLRFVPPIDDSKISHETNNQQQEPIAAQNGSVEKPLSLAGFDTMLNDSVQYIKESLLSYTPGYAASGVLICGNSGSGKSSLLETLSRVITKDKKLMCHVQYLSCSKLSDERFPVFKSKVQSWFDTACWHAPSIVFLDDIDRMLPAQVEHIDPFRSQQFASSFITMAKNALESRPIVLVASSQSPSSFHQFISSSHLFGKRVILRAPDKNARKEIISGLIKERQATSNFVADTVDPSAISTLTDGYLPSDLRDLVDRSIHKAAIRINESTPKPSSASDPFSLTIKDFETAQETFVPISLRDIKLQKTDILWADIGGLKETKKVLRETLEWPTKYGAIFASSPLRLRSGLLLYGYPGCGKTLLASAVAKECGLNFISVKGPEILNKYIGASEKSVRDLFERAQAAKPCVLFFDEFDSIAPKRGHDSTGVTDRVVNQMLTQMDGAEGLEGVYVLAATSRPDLIDPALLRPGRLDKSLLCDMPNQEERLEIMQACSRKLEISSDLNLSEYAQKSDGYTGADLQALIYNAHLDCVHSSMLDHTPEKSENTNGVNGVDSSDGLEYSSFGGPHKDDFGTLSRAEKSQIDKRLEAILENMGSMDETKDSQENLSRNSTGHKALIQPEHLHRSFETTRPSVPRQEIMRLKRIYDEFVSGRSSSGGLPSGEASGEIGGRSSLM